MRGRNHLMIVVVALISLIVVAQLLNATTGFDGADDSAGDVIGDVEPEYDPWFTSPFEPGESLEGWLFILQGVVGASLIVLALLLIARRPRSKTNEDV